MKIEYLKIDDLKPYKNNAKKHPKEQVEQIKNSIKEFGMNDPIGIWGKENIVVDAYQSFANVGGGCMNGKDPSKVDFSGAHKARELAKRFLKEKYLQWCEIQLSYAIGIAEPLAIYIDSNKGNIETTKSLYEECTPKRIINDLKLKEIDFEELAKFGHFTK